MEQLKAAFPLLLADLVAVFGEKQADIELEKLAERQEEMPELGLLWDAPAFRAFTWSLTEQGHKFWHERLLDAGVMDIEIYHACDLGDEGAELVKGKYPEHGKY